MTSRTGFYFSLVVSFILLYLGSPAEFSQLQVDDEIIAINNTRFSYKDTKEWEETMAKAQETGSLVMDIRRYGKSGELVIPLCLVF